MFLFFLLEDGTKRPALPGPVKHEPKQNSTQKDCCLGASLCRIFSRCLSYFFQMPLALVRICMDRDDIECPCELYELFITFLFL